MNQTRILNWQLVVPDEDAPLLLLPADGESVTGATVADPAALDGMLSAGAYHGVVVPDLGLWGEEVDGGVASLLSSLATTPGEGGWLFAAFANRSFPGRGRKRRGLRLGRALKLLRAAGLEDVSVYVPLPSHRQPAWMVPVERREELDLFLRQMVFPYAPVRSRVLAWIATRAIQSGRRLALAVPHRVRVRFAPSYALIARRPA